MINLFFFLIFFSKDLENSIRNHPEERLEKIQELGNELIDHDCMAESIIADVKSITDRWHLLQHQVKNDFIFFIKNLRICIPQK